MGVEIVHAEKYDRETIKKLLFPVFAQRVMALPKLLHARKVLLKPNFVIPESPEQGATTHPTFYLAIAELLKEWGKEVLIGESPAFGTTEQALARHGVLERCKQLGIRYLTFRKPKIVSGIFGHQAFHSFALASELDEVDAIINLPKLKVHQQTMLSGATKNLYGCIPGKRKAYYHFLTQNDLASFSRMLLRIAELVQPAYNIGDGILMMHQKGPRGGKLYPFHRILASESYLEFDWVFTQMLQIDPSSLPIFAVLTQKERSILMQKFPSPSHPLYPRLDGFIYPELTEIQFSFSQILRSLWRSIRQYWS